MLIQDMIRCYKSVTNEIDQHKWKSNGFSLVCIINSNNFTSQNQKNADIFHNEFVDVFIGTCMYSFFLVLLK